MSYTSLCKTAEYFEDRARRTRQFDKHERLAAIAKKYRLRAEIQRKLDRPTGSKDRANFEGMTRLRWIRSERPPAPPGAPLPCRIGGKMAGMADHPHTIDRWDDATGENLIEQIAAVGDYLVALETYRAAVKRWPMDKITLRNRARVIEQSWTEASSG